MKAPQYFSRAFKPLILVFALLGSSAHGKDIHRVPYGNDSLGDFDWNKLKPSKCLSYHACYNGLKCARLEVPLDWTNSSNPNTVVLAIGVLPAKVKQADPKHGGTVFIQPGGPGGSGLDLLRTSARGMQEIIDSDKHFDILAWDPRGVKFTTPSTACFENDLDRQVYSLKKSAVGFMDLSDSSFDKLWAAAEGFGGLCAQSTTGVYEDGSNIRQYVSTAMVARDMVGIVDALEEERQKSVAEHQRTQGLLTSESPPQLNYWGYSYGTMLGITFASMFPERIGRMILDGVVDAPDYAATGWTTNLQDTHKGLTQMLQDCFDGKELCPLYDDSMTSIQDLGQKVTKFMLHLRDNPIPVVHGGTVDLITISDVRYQIFDYLYSPMERYPWTGQMLADLMAGNTTLLVPELPRIKIPKSPTGLSISEDPVPPPRKWRESGYEHQMEATPSILCGDGDSLTNMTKKDYKSYLALLQHQEPLAAGYWAGIKLPCVFWPDSLRPEERNRFSGPFTSKRSNYSPGSSPVLFIGNTADPVTPVRNAHAMAKWHEDSVVLTQDMPGHCSGTFKPSECTFGHIKKFFATGELPEEGSICTGDRRPWDGKGAVGDPGFVEMGRQGPLQ
jgi:pimeloyl-ACP methyl ester carboxylesterase